MVAVWTSWFVEKKTSTELSRWKGRHDVLHKFLETRLTLLLCGIAERKFGGTEHEDDLGELVLMIFVFASVKVRIKMMMNMLKWIASASIDGEAEDGGAVDPTEWWVGVNPLWNSRVLVSTKSASVALMLMLLVFIKPQPQP